MVFHGFAAEINLIIWLQETAHLTDVLIDPW